MINEDKRSLTEASTQLDVAPKLGHTDYGSAPSVYASGIQISVIGNDAVIVFSKNEFVNGEPDTISTRNVCVVQICLSMQSLKDLSVISSNAVKFHEEKFGQIITEFTTSMPMQQA